MLDVPVVGPDDQHEVHVQRHPEPVTKRHEHHLQVDVVAKDEPQSEAGLEESSIMYSSMAVGGLLFFRGFAKLRA